MYFYRCTEQQLADALEHIHTSGDTLLHVVFKGGRDWVLICRKGDDPLTALVKAIEAGRFAPGGDLA